MEAAPSTKLGTEAGAAPSPDRFQSPGHRLTLGRLRLKRLLVGAILLLRPATVTRRKAGPRAPTALSPVLRPEIRIAGRPHDRRVGQANLPAAAFRALQPRRQVVMHGRRVRSETRSEILEVEPMAVVAA